MEFDYIVNIENFSGPLELLLTLVEKRKIPIAEIDILILIEDYLGYINGSSQDNLGNKIDFVLVTSELLEIKALELIKSEQKAEKERELKRRLEEYKMIKEIQEELSKLQKEKNISYSKKDSKKIIKKSREYVLKDIKQIDLFNHYQKYLDSLNEDEYLELNIDKVFSIEEERERVYILVAQGEKSFYELFLKAKSKSHLIYIFLSILELYKDGVIDLEEDRAILIK